MATNWCLYKTSKIKTLQSKSIYKPVKKIQQKTGCLKFMKGCPIFNCSPSNHEKQACNTPGFYSFNLVKKKLFVGFNTSQKH